MWYLATLLIGIAIGVYGTIKTAQLYERATSTPREAEHAEHAPNDMADSLTMTYAQLLRYRELVDDDGNLRRH